MTTQSARASRGLGIGVFCALSALAPALLLGCRDDDPCDPGQVYKDSNCLPIPTGTGGSTAMPGSGGAGGTGSEASQFGKTCATADDCGGDAPVCGAPQLPICTQVLCAAGEANEGVCPPAWQCLTVAPNPSVCVNF